MALGLTNYLLDLYVFLTKRFNLGNEAASVSFRGRQIVDSIFTFSLLRGSILAPRLRLGVFVDVRFFIRYVRFLY